MEDPSQRHWVEDLFPPHFTLSLSDLSKEPQQADGGTQEAWRLSQRKKAKDIYHQVKARLDAEAQIPKHKNIQVGEPLGDLKQNVRLTGKVTRTESSRREKASRSHDDDDENGAGTSDNGLWSAGEIGILRQEFQKVKEEKQIIHIELKALQKHYRDLQKKFKQQTAVLDSKVNALKQSRQENERLQLQNQHLTKDVRLQKSKLAMAEDDYREIVEQRLMMRKEAIDFRKTHSRVKQDLTELRIKLAEANTRHRLESLEKEETMRLEYESQIAALYQELGECKAELEKEQTEHRRSRKALDHLRVHFAQQSAKAQPKQPSPSDRRTLKVLQLY